ncbi:MAG: sigma-70 family RNA polymerase sigma factor [Planctomycetes bacterium]|nr:sigma-70 family RNA polymerase sigma factor [Planctomycetota bacterium]
MTTGGQNGKETALWAQYRQARSRAALDALLRFYWGDVEAEARRVAARGYGYTCEDLVGPGAEGLWTAIKAFDPTRGPFVRYMRRRIRGAMIDFLRSSAPWTRTRYAKAVTLNDANEAVRQGRLQECSDYDVARELGMSMRDYHRFKGCATLPAIGPLARADADGNVNDLPFPAAQAPVGAELERADFWHFVARRFLPQERRILLGYFRDGKTMKEIGANLSLSESRVSQIVSHIRRRLRRMADRIIEEAPI